MFISPYQTTACRQYHLSSIIHAVKEELIEDKLRQATFADGGVVEGLYEVLPHSHSISPFTQTISFEYQNKTLFAVDMRPFMSKKPDSSGVFSVYSDIEYQMAKVNALLSKKWMEGEIRAQSTFGDVAGKTFTRLLTDSIVRRLAVGVVEQMHVAAVSAYYYLCLFEAEGDQDETHRLRLFGRVARLTMIPAETVVEVLKPLQHLKDLSDYCDALRAVSQSERFQVVTPAMVLTSIGSVWFGANAREHVALAMEYPPTFNALIYCALTYRGYHSAPLSRLVLQVDRNGGGKDFARSLTAYLKD